jgi:hypothetical protein
MNNFSASHIFNCCIWKVCGPIGGLGLLLFWPSVVFCLVVMLQLIVFRMVLLLIPITTVLFSLDHNKFKSAPRCLFGILFIHGIEFLFVPGLFMLIYSFFTPNICSLLLKLSNDVESNPGPGPNVSPPASVYTRRPSSCQRTGQYTSSARWTWKACTPRMTAFISKILMERQDSSSVHVPFADRSPCPHGRPTHRGRRP